MCGIVGYVGKEPAWPILLEGLQRLEYRGYDSAGIAVLDSAGQLRLRKTVGKVDGLSRMAAAGFPQGAVGLGHTRWATHGPPTDANAHPLTGCSRRVAVVHNGIVENFLELKRGLRTRGHTFASDTDTEVIAHLIEEGIADGLTFAAAFRAMGQRLEGSQAVAALCQEEPNQLCALRLGHAGGIVIAHREGEGIVGSDLPAALPLLRPGVAPPGAAAFLEAGEMAVVTREGVIFSDLAGRPLDKERRAVSLEEALVDKGGYRHFMLKEIMEQPQAVAGALRGRVNFEAGQVELPDFPLNPAEIDRLQRVILIACGTSLNAGQVGRSWLERFAGLPSEADSASEFRYREPPLSRDTLVIGISQSGETADTVAALQSARERGARTLALCNGEGSQLSRLAEATLYMGSGLEIGVASTKTFIASLTLLQLLAIYLGQARGHLTDPAARELLHSLAQAPRLLGDLLADLSPYQRLARQFRDYGGFLFLGRGANAAIAQEGALKLKEISYIHAEGYPAGEMKHGPIALIDRNMATLALAPRDGLYDKMVGNIREVKAREGVTLAVLTQGDTELAEQVDAALYLPPAPEPLTPLLATVPLQLLAYHIALLRGCDVDQPRNLAKSVTVE